MSAIFDGPNKAPKVDAYELARDLSADATQELPDISQFQGNDPEFVAALDWATRSLDQGGVSEGDVDPTLGEIMRAAFQQENTLGSYMARSVAEDDTPDISPEEIYTRVNNEGLLPFLDDFRGVRTEGEYEARKANVSRELQNRQLLDAAGWGGTFATLGAAVADPINFVPVGGAAVRVGKLASRGRKAAVETALAGTMGAGIAEGALHATQETRTAGESVLAVAAGTVLGGTLGFAIDKVFGREIAEKAFDRYDGVRSGQSRTGVGADVVRDLDTELDARFANDERLTSLGMMNFLESVEKIPVIGKHLASPARVLARSNSGAARVAMKMLVSDPTITAGNAAGRRSLDNVEAAFGRVKGEYGQAQREVSAIYAKHKDAYGKKRDVFNSRVARALAHGDRSPDGDAVAEQAAKVLRQRVYAPLKESLIDNGVFKDAEEAQLLNAESYFPLVYSPDGVRGDEAAFTEFHEAVFSRVIAEDARNTLVERDIRKSNIEDETIAHKGVRQLVPKVDENGNPVINPKTGRQVMTEKIIAKGKVRELREIAKQTFEAEAKELRAERDTVLNAFNKGDDWPYAGPGALDNPVASQFEKGVPLRAKANEIDGNLALAKAEVAAVRDAEIKDIEDAASAFERLFTGPRNLQAHEHSELALIDEQFEAAADMITMFKDAQVQHIKRKVKSIDLSTVTPVQARTIGEKSTKDIAAIEARAKADIAKLAKVVDEKKKAVEKGARPTLTGADIKKVRDSKASAIRSAKQEAERFVRHLEAKSAKQRAPVGEKLDALAKEIDDHYGKRISDAKSARDEAVTAANDAAIAAIMKARGVELTEGYTSVLAKYTRGGQIAEDLVAKEAAKRANGLYRSIVDGGDPMVDYEVMGGLSGYAKMRKNPADHVQLMDKGWALSDAMAITDRYTKTAGMDSVLGRFFRREADKLDENGAKVFDANGNVEKTMVADVGLSSVRKKIVDEYAGMVSRAVPDSEVQKLATKYADDPSQLDTELKALKVKHEKQLLAKRDEDLEALDTLLNFARGRSSKPGSQRTREIAEKVGIFNYVRLMGGIVVSALGDPLNLVISQGLGNTIRHGVVPILKDFKAALRSADGEARRLARLSGANLEMEFNATMAEIGGFTNPWVGRDKMHVWRSVAEKFSSANGIKYWNTLWKQVAYNTTQARIVEDSLKGWSKLSTSEQAWLANLGVDEFRLNDFAHYFNAQTSKTVAGGMPLARWDEWADKAAGEAFRAAAYKESFNVVITPGLYDRLNAHSDPVGRLILQFRNHMFANAARLTARNVQLSSLGMDKAAHAMTGLTGLIMMGALIDAIKTTLGDTTIDGDTVSGESALDQVLQEWQEAPVQSLYNANDRAGWLGPVFESSNILHSTAGAGLQDMLRLLSDEDPIGYSRIGGRSILDVAGGATAGLVSDTIMSAKRGVSAALDEEQDLTLSDVKRMERLGLPMNLPYLRPLINEFNQHVGTMYDWPTGY